MKFKHFSGLSEMAPTDITDKNLFRGIVEVETPQELNDFVFSDEHIKTVLHEFPWGFAVEEVGEYFEPLAWMDDPSASDVGEWLPWHNIHVFMPV